MVVKNALKNPNEQGQSLIEFLLLLPMLIGITVILVRINTAIQISIVDQQYARAQALHLAYNSAFYPALTKQSILIATSTNQMILGISDNVAPETGDYTPKATVQLIARSKNVSASDSPKEEPPTRANVRIRNTVTLCTPSVFVSGGKGGGMAILPLGPDFVHPAGPSALTESTHFSICGSPITYEQ